jgi:hypothetical protein
MAMTMTMTMTMIVTIMMREDEPLGQEEDGGLAPEEGGIAGRGLSPRVGHPHQQRGGQQRAQLLWGERGGGVRGA